MTQQVPNTLHPKARPIARNMIAVASGKGGVGKTWFSVTLAHALARRGQKTLLFDGDLGLANVDIQLGLMPSKDLGMVVAGKIPMAEAVNNYDQGGFDVLAGKSGSGIMAAIKRERLLKLRDDLFQMSKVYDKTLVDLGAGVEAGVRVLAAISGTILVVSTDEPTSITDAYAFIKVMNSVRPGCDLRIVVNTVTSQRDGERTYNTLYKACDSFLKIQPPLAGIIRRDPKVKDSIRAQTPILTRSPGTHAAQDVEAIAEKLLQG